MERINWRYRRSLVGTVVAVNVLPLLGVWLLGWQVVAVLTVYWVELGAAIVTGIVMACPAELVTLPLPGRRTTELKTKRGSVSFAGVEFHLRNAGVVLALLLSGVGWLLIGVLSAAYPAFPVSPLTIGIGPLSVGGALAIAHVLIARAYLRTERYRDVPPEDAARPALAFALGTFTLLTLVTIIDSQSVQQSVVFVAIMVKFCTEVGVRCRARDSFDRLGDGVDPFERELTRSEKLSLTRYAGRLPAVTAANNLQKTVCPARSTLLIAAPFVVAVSAHRVPSFGLFTTLGGIGLLILGANAVVFFVVGAGLACLVVPGLFISALRDVPIEYQFHADRLVCQDSWLHAAQWSVAYDRIQHVDTTRGPVERLTGAGTVVIELEGESTARLRSLGKHREVLAFLASRDRET